MARGQPSRRATTPQRLRFRFVPVIKKCKTIGNITKTLKLSKICKTYKTKCIIRVDYEIFIFIKEYKIAAS